MQQIFKALRKAEENIVEATTALVQVEDANPGAAHRLAAIREKLDAALTAFARVEELLGHESDASEDQRYGQDLARTVGRIRSDEGKDLGSGEEGTEAEDQKYGQELARKAVGTIRSDGK